jgi:hypothetical protein
LLRCPGNFHKRAAAAGQSPAAHSSTSAAVHIGAQSSIVMSAHSMARSDWSSEPILRSQPAGRRRATTAKLGLLISATSSSALWRPVSACRPAAAEALEGWPAQKSTTTTTATSPRSRSASGRRFRFAAAAACWPPSAQMALARCAARELRTNKLHQPDTKRPDRAEPRERRRSSHWPPPPALNGRRRESRRWGKFVLFVRRPRLCAAFHLMSAPNRRACERRAPLSRPIITSTAVGRRRRTRKPRLGSASSTSGRLCSAAAAIAQLLREQTPARPLQRPAPARHSSASPL